MKNMVPYHTVKIKCTRFYPYMLANILIIEAIKYDKQHYCLYLWAETSTWATLPCYYCLSQQTFICRYESYVHVLTVTDVELKRVLRYGCYKQSATFHSRTCKRQVNLKYSWQTMFILKLISLSPLLYILYVLSSLACDIAELKNYRKTTMFHWTSLSPVLLTFRLRTSHIYTNVEANVICIAWISPPSVVLPQWRSWLRHYATSRNVVDSIASVCDRQTAFQRNDPQCKLHLFAMQSEVPHVLNVRSTTIRFQNVHNMRKVKPLDEYFR
jgi:hypothetical protein